MEITSTDDLKQDPHNANLGTVEGEAMLTESLRECGAGRSVLVDRNGVIIAGNKTALAATGLPVQVIQTTGDTLVVVQRTDLSLEDERARRLALYDNRASELGLDWNIQELMGQDEAMLQGLFDEMTVETLEPELQEGPSRSRVSPAQVVLVSIGDFWGSVSTAELGTIPDRLIERWGVGDEAASAFLEWMSNTIT